MAISVFDLFKVGIGPSSSHTVGPMRAARLFALRLQHEGLLPKVARVSGELLGSLGATGRGHGSDRAVQLGWMGHEPDTVALDSIEGWLQSVRTTRQLTLLGQHEVAFDPARDLVLDGRRHLPFHPNAMTLSAWDCDGHVVLQETWYSVGGGFVVSQAVADDAHRQAEVAPGPEALPLPFHSAAELLGLCQQHGLTVAEVIQKSSNVGTVKMAMQIEPRELWEMYSAVGFGQKPQIPFPGVVSGRLRPYKTWRPIEQATMSYGYGISGSLFQVARAYTVFARDGEIVPTTLLKAEQQVQGVRVFSAENARAVRKMLNMAAAPGGTAPKAQTVGYSVGGKTGTAHKQEGKGYAGKKYRGFFVGMAPIDQPRIVVAVMIDEPSNGRYFGGEVAAPVFSTTVQQTLRLLGIQPDLSVKPQVVAKAVEESF